MKPSRFAVIVLFAGGALSGMTGCAAHQPTPQEAARRHQAEILRWRAEDKKRLAGEGSSSPTWTVGKMDLTSVREVMVSMPHRVYQSMRGQTSLAAARSMEDSASAENRRIGVLKLTEFPYARTGDYVKRYEQIYDHDDDALVRAAALRALNRSRDIGAVDRFIAGLGDTDAFVRLEAAKGLANVPSEKAVRSLIGHLETDDNKDVRIAVADALRTQHTLEVARALINVLQDREFGVAWQARRSLVIMTGRDLNFDESQWLNYFNAEQHPFAS